MILEITAAIVVVVGIIVLRANPSRFPNQVFSVTLAILLLWIGCTYGRWHDIPLFAGSVIEDRNLWIRLINGFTAFLPWATWLLMEAVVVPDHERMKTFRRSLPWFMLGVFLAAICFTPHFILSPLRENIPNRGWPYYAYSLVTMAAFAYLTFQASRRMRREHGIRRVEMQFLSLNVAASSLAANLLVFIANFFQIPGLKRFSIIIGLVSLALAGWAMTSHRVFDAGQFVLSFAQRLALSLVFGLAVIFLWQLHEKTPGYTVDLLVGVFLACSAIFWLDQKSRGWLNLDGEKTRSELRAAVIGLARTEPNATKLIAEFERLLQKHCSTTTAFVVVEPGDARFTLPRDRPAHAALCESGWATPERIQRRRSSPELDDLRAFLLEHALGLIAAAPRGSARPSLLVAVGAKSNRWPYTQPEIDRMENIVELMDNILTHSRLTTQAATKAKLEHLAIMSRGLAHDLKNLITPVSSFLIHTERHGNLTSDEAEVHAAAKRSMRIMTDYVREALSFSDRLEPKLEVAAIDRIFDAVREVTIERARARAVAIAIEGEANLTLVADAVLLQRLLGNLVSNAIDASARARIITLSAATGPGGGIRLQVRDEGCGIAPQHLGQVFEPYFTTKEFGDDVRGFGLGLTISQKIVHLHHGTIAVESELGRGTTVTVDLPATQPDQPALPSSSRPPFSRPAARPLSRPA